METDSRHRENDGQAIAERDERQLIQRVKAGSQEAFAALIRQYGPAVYGYLARCGLPLPTRNAAFQRVFARARSDLENLRPERPLCPWLFAIAVQAVRWHHREQRVRELVYPELQGDNQAPSTGDQPAALSDTAPQLIAAVARLPLEQREVVGLVCAKQLSLADAATALQVSPGTFETRMRQARLALAVERAARNARSPAEVAP